MEDSNQYWIIKKHKIIEASSFQFDIMDYCVDVLPHMNEIPFWNTYNRQGTSMNMIMMVTTARFTQNDLFASCGLTLSHLEVFHVVPR